MCIVIQNVIRIGYLDFRAADILFRETNNIYSVKQRTKCVIMRLCGQKRRSKKHHLAGGPPILRNTACSTCWRVGWNQAKYLQPSRPPESHSDVTVTDFFLMWCFSYYFDADILVSINKITNASSVLCRQIELNQINKE